MKILVALQSNKKVLLQISNEKEVALAWTELDAETARTLADNLYKLADLSEGKV